MPASYIVSIHAGSSAAIAADVNFVNYSGDSLKTQAIWLNCWDNPMLIAFKKSDGTYTSYMEFDNAWQPIQVPLAFAGFRIIDKAAGFHARYQIIGMA